MKNSRPFTLLIASGTDYPKSVLTELTRNTAHLCYRLSYTPPYEQFNGLRKLLLQIRRESKTEIPEVLVLDLTEWIEHETDEYLDAAVKYLYDHRDIYDYIFVVRNCSRRKCLPLFLKLRTFMAGTITEDLTFSDKSYLAEYLTESHTIDSDALDILTSIFMQDPDEQYKSYTVADNILEELSLASENDTITLQSIRAVISDSQTLLGAMTGGICRQLNNGFIERKELLHDKKAV